MKELEMHSIFHGLPTLASESKAIHLRQFVAACQAKAVRLERANKLTAQAELSARSLRGVEVLDTPNFIAAPMCSMYLAGFGIELIQVERPRSGDAVRCWGEVRQSVGLCCDANITGYLESSPPQLRSKPNDQVQQSIQPEETQK